MRMNKNRLIAFLKWLLIVFLLGYMALIMTFSENTFDQALRPLCPEGLWHTGLNWIHCAYPPISIAKYTSMYLVYSILSLLIILMFAPCQKVIAGKILLYILSSIPAALLLYGLLFTKFSWILLFCFLGIATLTVSFIIFTKVTHNPAFKRDALKRAP
jgi:hypothetical protein